MEKSVFWVISISYISKNIRIFNSYFIDEIKNIGIVVAYKKSRLIVKVYNDYEKEIIFTQTLIIKQIN